MSQTLGNILDAVKRGASVEDQELRHALLAMENLWTFLNMDLRRLAGGDTALPAMKHYEVAFGRNKRALNTPPTEWLGDNIPENPEWQQRRKGAEALMRAALEGRLPGQENK